MSDPKDVLRGYLQRAHETLLWKLDGLDDYDIRRPLVPTGTNLLGLLKHCAGVEAGYLGEVFGRPFAEPLPWMSFEAEANADMWATAERVTRRHPRPVRAGGRALGGDHRRARSRRDRGGAVVAGRATIGHAAPDTRSPRRGVESPQRSRRYRAGTDRRVGGVPARQRQPARGRRGTGGPVYVERLEATAQTFREGTS